MINYHNKIFRSLSNTANGEVSSETIFSYKQQGNVVTACYGGGSILNGHLIATVNEGGVLNMRYHHVNTNGELMTGTCISTPEILPSGKVCLHEKWQWTSGDMSSGESVIEEI